MKTAFLFCSILLPLGATAQKLVATDPPNVYHVGSEKAALYRSPADATGKAYFFLSPGAEATVVGYYLPHWAVVKQEGFCTSFPLES